MLCCDPEHTPVLELLCCVRTVIKHAHLCPAMFYIGKDSVSKIELGTNRPSSQTIELICSKFNVNPEWLKDGAEVPMFLEVADDDEILIARIMAGEDEFRKSVFRAFAKMDDESWEMLRQVVDQIKNAGR